MRLAALGLVLTCCLAAPAVAAPFGDAAAILDAMVAALHREGRLELAGEQVIAGGAVVNFYQANGHVPAWTRSTAVSRLLAAIDDLRDDGLDPADYHRQALASLGAATPADPELAARRDVLLTDALLLALYHLVFGKADPNHLDQDWNLDELYDGLDLASAQTRDQVIATIVEAVAAGDPRRLIDRARPRHPFYVRLRAAHVRYRKLAAAGGWPTVPAGPVLRSGDRDPRVAALRGRLAATGDLAASESTGTAFDDDVAAAVVRFQTRHGLDADGLVGAETVAALDVPAAERAEAIRANLERTRWVMTYDVGPELLVVNIAAYQVWLARNDEIVWRARCQVGTPYTRTPVFADAMTYLEFNPTWTVPASIADRTILPEVRRDPAYLAAQNMVLLDSAGHEVAAASVDWSTVSSMPYTVRQNPGPGNALGRVKFMFPNKHSVYLHDTPSRTNFGRAARAFSSGCIRIERPLELAALLLGDQPGWTREHIDAVVAGGRRTTVRLSKPVPVFLLYWTAYVEDDGSVCFRKDLYERDAAVLEALAGPVRLHRRHDRSN